MCMRMAIIEVHLRFIKVVDIVDGYYSLSSVAVHVVGDQQNRLGEAVLTSTHSMSI